MRRVIVGELTQGPLLQEEILSRFIRWVRSFSSQFSLSGSNLTLIQFDSMPDGPSKRSQVVPAGLTNEGDTVNYERKREKTNTKRSGGKRKNVKDLHWILKKKELYRARGKEGVPRDSKYVLAFFFSADFSGFSELTNY